MIQVDSQLDVVGGFRSWEMTNSLKWFGACLQHSLNILFPQRRSSI